MLKSRDFRRGTLCLLLLTGWLAAPLNANDLEKKARELIAASIEAMGGDAYRNVRTATSQGRYFFFRQGRKGFTRYTDATVYQDPVKWRFEIGKGRRLSVQVYNLELDKGWEQDGQFDVEEVSAESLENFKTLVKRDVDYILRSRLDEEGIKLFYYGPDEISGSGNWEAVEFLDVSNDSVVVYFNRDTHLPEKVETHQTDRLGIRRKEEVEYHNWHPIDGVLAPLRIDVYVGGELSQQRFLEQLAFNQTFPPDHFLKPTVKVRKKDKKNKKNKKN